MIKNNMPIFLLFVIFFLMFWNTFDLLYSVFIADSLYQFAAIKDLAVPLILAFIIGYILFFKERKD